VSLARSGACAAHARSTGSAHSPRSNLECAGRGTTLQNLDAKLGVRRQAVSRATPLSSASGVQKRRRSRRPDEQTLVPPGAPRDESWAGGRVSPRAALPLCGRIFRGSLRSTGRGKCHLPAAALRAAPTRSTRSPGSPPPKKICVICGCSKTRAMHPPKKSLRLRVSALKKRSPSRALRRAALGLLPARAGDAPSLRRRVPTLQKTPRSDPAPP
jgi:hypothetical protein